MSTYAIGDIQGCYDELRQLLDKVKFDPAEDILWLTGDLINRGQKSLETLRFIKDLGERCITVLGNHDLHLLGLAGEVRKGAHYDTLDDILNAPDRDEIMNWLRHQKLLHYDQAINFALCHAGIYPLWDIDQAVQYANKIEKLLRADNYLEILPSLYGNDNSAENRFIVNVFTRMRYCFKSDCSLELTNKDNLDHMGDDLIPWFDFPNRKTANINIIFGHWASLMGKVDRPHLFALDTGCCWGHYLTAMRVEDLQKFEVECI
jgi:bis(5'-nucleosyl)-tetraphosphatase (symmetrical)